MLSTIKNKPLTLLRAVRKYCLTRCANGPKEVSECDDVECPIFQYRMMKQPSRAGIGVGTRDGKGRFRRKETAQAGNSANNNEHEGVDKAGTILIKPRGSKDEISICRKGQVSIQHKGGEILIKISPEKKEAQHVENSEGKKR